MTNVTNLTPTENSDKNVIKGRNQITDQEILEAKLDNFARAQQCLMDSFKVKMSKVCDEILGAMYTDVTQYADSDAHTNYLNYLKDVFRDEIIKEVALSDYGHYSWAHGIRMALVEKYPKEIGNKVIEDLKHKVKTLEDHIEQMRPRY